MLSLARLVSNSIHTTLDEKRLMVIGKIGTSVLPRPWLHANDKKKISFDSDKRDYFVVPAGDPAVTVAVSHYCNLIELTSCQSYLV